MNEEKDKVEIDLSVHSNYENSPDVLAKKGSIPDLDKGDSPPALKGGIQL